MDNLRTQSCLKMLKKIMRRPICRPFLLNEHGKIRYHRLQNIKLPTLEALQNDLIDGKITSYTMFFNRINTFFDKILSNCNKLNQEVIIICITELKNYTAKMKKKTMPRTSNPKVWSDSLKNNYLDLVQSLKGAEPPMEELRYRIETDPNEPLFIPFDPLEIKLLSNAIKMIDDDKTMNGVISIVRSLEPSSNSKSATGEFVCDLTSCQPQTLYTLRNYIQDQFRKENIPYPESNDAHLT